MKNTRQNSETLLAAWLKLYSAVWNERIVTGMTFNEAYICNLLLHGDGITATGLCETTGLLKSQMNKTLNEMENKGYILRTRSVKDKRVVYITLTEAGEAAYNLSHEKTMKVVDALTLALGEEATCATAASLSCAADKIKVVLREGIK